MKRLRRQLCTSTLSSNRIHPFSSNTLRSEWTRCGNGSSAEWQEDVGKLALTDGPLLSSSPTHITYVLRAPMPYFVERFGVFGKICIPPTYFDSPPPTRDAHFLITPPKITKVRHNPRESQFPGPNSPVSRFISMYNMLSAGNSQHERASVGHTVPGCEPGWI
jgi:hypothetical protein